MLSSVPVDLKPKSVDVNAKTIHLVWPDDHETSISFKDIEHLQQERKPEKISETISEYPIINVMQLINKIH